MILGVYQAIDPKSDLTGSAIREAFACRLATIEGLTIIRATDFSTTGVSSFGPAANETHVCMLAEESVTGFYKSAIEPAGNQWGLTIYEGSQVTPIHESTHPSANEAIKVGRTELRRLADACYVS
jgi:hypothetical protein